MIDPDQFLLLDAADVSYEQIAEAVDSAMTLLNSSLVKLSAKGQSSDALTAAWDHARNARNAIRRL